MKSKLQSIFFDLKKIDGHTLEVFKKSISSTFVKVLGMLIGLLVSVYLGRSIGSEGLGVINLSIKFTNIFLVVCLVGMPQVVIKEVAIGFNNKDNDTISDVIYTSLIINGIITIVFSLIIIFLSSWISNDIFKDSNFEIPLIIGVLAAGPQVFSRIFSSGLIGYKKIWQSNLVNQSLSTFVTGLLLLLNYLIYNNITVNKVAVFYGISRIVVTLVMVFYWRHIHEPTSRSRNLLTKRLLNTSIPIFYVFLASALIGNVDSIILGMFSGSEDVGLYSVASRIALLTSFFLQVTNSSVAPKIAALYHDNKIPELEKMVSNVTKILILIGSFQFLIFILFGREILNIWGEEFVSAYPILILLGFGQLINISTGASGLLLTMTGKEKIERNISIVSAVILLSFSILLAPHFYSFGVAIATLISVSFLNISRIFLAKKYLGVTTIKF